MTQHALHSFFWPQSIAVLGASPDIHRIRGRLLHQLRENGFPGRVLRVAPYVLDAEAQNRTLEIEVIKMVAMAVAIAILTPPCYSTSLHS